MARDEAEKPATDLIRGLLARDEGAFRALTALIERYSRSWLPAGVGRHRGDIVEEVVVRIWQLAWIFRDDDHLRAVAHGMIRRAAIDRLRRERRHEHSALGEVVDPVDIAKVLESRDTLTYIASFLTGSDHWKAVAGA